MSLNQLAETTIGIIGDYHQEFGQELTTNHVESWALQFGEDAEFVLEELNGILDKTYISKKRARELLKKRLDNLIKVSKCSKMLDFISKSKFLILQKSEKSQTEIIHIIDEILITDYGITRLDYEEDQKVNFIYFDDIIATGGTVCGHLEDWLKENVNGKPNHVRVVSKEINLIVSCFCVHYHSYTLMQFILMKSVQNDRLEGKWQCYADYVIKDHPTNTKQDYNCIIPLKSELTDRALSYLDDLQADRQLNRAFRPINTPEVENLFSSRENRAKFERIFIEKGLDILENVVELNTNQRPLGVTRPSYKTLGMGTLFFSWRNIPNNCPIVFWWNGHGWKPLFPLRNRGN